jgi:twitching motility protein PilT
MNIQELLEIMTSRNASDLHLTVGLPPMIRVNGNLMAISEERLGPEDTTRLSYSVMNEKQKKLFETNGTLDFSFGIANVSRFRANIYKQRSCVALAVRVIPLEIKTFEDLGLGKNITEFCDRSSGLVLVTGATGSGKSTTLAAMIDKLNREEAYHILTIEDPIEFLHRHNKSMVNQREVHSDTEDFAGALRVALRQDPDVVLIGEMRDLETIRAALTIAETGHLTFATLHTNSAVQTISRIVDAFPKEEQQTVRAQLAFVLQGIVCQMLVPGTKKGRVLVTEVLNITPAIRSLIRDDKLHQIEGIMEVSSKFGMITLNARLAELYRSRQIDKETALTSSQNPEQLKKLMGEF